MSSLSGEGIPIGKCKRTHNPETISSKNSDALDVKTPEQKHSKSCGKNAENPGAVYKSFPSKLEWEVSTEKEHKEEAKV